MTAAKRTCTCHPAGADPHPPRVYRTPEGLWVSPLPVIWAPYRERFTWWKPSHALALAATLAENRGRVPTAGGEA